jgi:uncharacterized RDD family membrane protein YckC
MMNRKEFLSELENSLEGKLPQDEIREILTDYNDIFESYTYDEKSDESTTLELGSPAKIARKILEDTPIYIHGQENQFKPQVNKVNTNTKDLASISKRFVAFAMDTIVGTLILAIILFTAFLPFSTREMVTWSEATGSNGYEARLYKDNNGLTTKVEVLDRTGKYLFKGSTEDFSSFLDLRGIDYPEDFQARQHVITYKKTLPKNIRLLILLISLGAGNLFNSFITWKYDGYTVGKKLFKIKVEKIDGSKISFIDALLRELVIKSIANVILGGLINIGSFIWACLSNEQNTLHDRAVKTIVVSVKG